jgi:hypothetical protein
VLIIIIIVHVIITKIIKILLSLQCKILLSVAFICFGAIHT